METARSFSMVGPLISEPIASNEPLIFDGPIIFTEPTIVVGPIIIVGPITDQPFVQLRRIVHRPRFVR